MVANTHEVQSSHNQVRDWFLPVATKVKPDIAKGITAQGRYIVAADGTAYGYNNNRSIERVLALMDTALKQFAASPPPKVEIPQEVLNAEFVPTAPPGSAIVRLHARIKPAPLGSDSANQNVSRDHLWILPHEMDALAKAEMPETLKLRLTRFALIDNVRGEPDYWTTNEIVKSDFSLRKLGPLKISLTGRFTMRSKDASRGYDGDLEGELTFNNKGRLISFKAFANGEAWGRSTYTPNPPPGRFPLVLAFVLANDEASRIVAPQAVFYGEEYLKGR